MVQNNNKGNFCFRSKAETLEELKDTLKKSVILDLYKFRVKEWNAAKDHIFFQVKKIIGPKKAIIRSSALNEDQDMSSNAGHYKSVLDVSLENMESFEKAVDAVIGSYQDGSEDHFVFIQEMISEVDLSGVIFTRDLNTRAPYLIINYDDVSGRTDTITSGKGVGLKTLVAFKDEHVRVVDARIGEILESVKEIEGITGNDSLDIEFAYKGSKVYILQVRPIVFRDDIKEPKHDAIKSMLSTISVKLDEMSIKHPGLFGDKAIYGIMPDWNPAEMIGVKPRPLSISLYKELITDNIWAYQRDNYGYRNLRSFPLMAVLAGHPYIDVRVDFNSFVPKQLSSELSNKLVNYYLDKLISMPDSHDKVEFDIVFSCYTLDIDSKLEELASSGFSHEEILMLKQSLLELTNKIINVNGLYRTDLSKIRTLEIKREEISRSAIPDISKIYWLIEDCKRYGTLPFAGIARAAFIAMQFINSLVDLKIITQEEKNLFIKSLNTVAKQLSRDINQLSRRIIGREEFFKKYGHLRPGTYDILSESYEENPEKYFNLEKLTFAEHDRDEQFSFSARQRSAISELLRTHRIEANFDDFIEFIREAIEGREYAKFIFTKNINEILKLIKRYGQGLGLCPEQLSFMDIGSLMKMYSTVVSGEKEHIQSEIEKNMKSYELYKPLKLPHLICDKSDLFYFYLDNIKPNYITHGKVSGEKILLDCSAAGMDRMQNRIIFIESADPGFDWIFSHGISGLVTMYGGVNSHMAIRSAELNIPAVIGCGSVNFEAWSKANKLEIDCLNKKVSILS